jgi:spore coat protein U-like protein
MRPDATRHLPSHKRIAAPVLAGVLASLSCAQAQADDCTVASTSVAFGVYDPTLITPTDSSGNLTVRCTHSGRGASRINYTVTLSAGGSGNFALRQMRAGTATLDYNLYRDAARSLIWGTGTGGSGLVTGALVVNAGHFRISEVTYPIYGRIPAQQAVATGLYTDAIVVTLTF